MIKYASCKFQSRMILSMCRSIELLGIQRSFWWGNASVWLVRRCNAFRPGEEGRRPFNWEESGLCRQGQRFRTASVLPGVKHWAAPTDCSLWWPRACFPHVPEVNLQFHCSSGDKHTESQVIRPAGKILLHYAEVLCTSPAKSWALERALTHSLSLRKKLLLQQQCSAEEQLWMRGEEVIRNFAFFHSSDMG